MTSAALTGSGALSWFALRRDRVRIATWIVSIAGLVVVTVASIKGLYPTRADLVQAAIASEGNAAAIAFNGPAQGLDTVGGQVAFQMGSFGLVAVGLMTLLIVGRLTRGEEESGRLELVRSLPVGADAPNATALLIAGGMNVVVGAAVAVVLLALGLPTEGSVVFGISFMLFGLVFIGVTLVAAQISENTRVVYGIAGAVLGAAFALRAVGDIGDGTISWLSPIGWAQKARPFAGEVWWPFLIMIAAAGALVAGAVVLGRRRDVGGGLVAPRAGPAHASRGLGRPIGLALRLQRASVVGWGTAVLLLGVAYGSIADSINDFIEDNETVAEVFTARTGASIVDSYLSMSFRIVALVAAGFAIQAVLRIRGEETSMHAEQILATPTSRARWAAGHLVVATLGSVVLLLVAAVAVGGSAAAVTGDVTVLREAFGASLAYLPALGVMMGVTMGLVGAAPRVSGAAWGLFAFAFVVAMLGQVLDLPTWVLELSPFEHVPQLPAEGVAVLPLVLLGVVAIGLGAFGLAALRRRDLG